MGMGGNATSLALVGFHERRSQTMRTLRVSDMSPVDVVRITQKAALVAMEYERHCGDTLDAEDKQTLRILSVMAVAGDVLARDGDGHERGGV
jgi:hypothetical protein